MARILIVDDEESIIRSVGALLETESHSVTGVMSGTEALKELKTKPFDLMITDIRMSPVDGLEIIQWCKKNRPEMPAVVISALTSDEAEDMAREAGCCGYIRKPFRINDVLDCINKVLPKS